jgi:hypothetical protein
MQTAVCRVALKCNGIMPKSYVLLALEGLRVTVARPLCSTSRLHLTPVQYLRAAPDESDRQQSAHLCCSKFVQ